MDMYWDCDEWVSYSDTVHQVWVRASEANEVAEVNAKAGHLCRSCGKRFENQTELKAAVDQYIRDPTIVAQIYVVNKWNDLSPCFIDITILTVFLNHR